MKTQQLKEFIALFNEIEKENEELAMAIHNDLIQQLFAIRLQHASIREKICQVVPKDILQTIDEQNQELTEVADLLKYLYYALHPYLLKHFGLAKAIKQVVTDFEGQYDSSVNICFDLTLPEPTIEPKNRLQIYRAIFSTLKLMLSKNKALTFDLRLEFSATALIFILDANASISAVPNKIELTNKEDNSLKAILARLLVLNAKVDKRTDWCSYCKISFPI